MPLAMGSLPGARAVGTLLHVATVVTQLCPQIKAACHSAQGLRKSCGEGVTAGEQIRGLVPVIPQNVERHGLVLVIGREPACSLLCLPWPPRLHAWMRFWFIIIRENLHHFFFHFLFLFILITTFKMNTEVFLFYASPGI